LKFSGVRIDINRNDSYNWGRFIIDLYRQSEYVENCEEMVPVVQRVVVDASSLSSFIYKFILFKLLQIEKNFNMIFDNQSVGYYCFSITPYSGPCTSNQHPTDFPETEFSSMIRLGIHNFHNIHSLVNFGLF
jgi:hypothetical protein